MSDTATTKPNGAFAKGLFRTNKNIRDDRARVIVAGAKTHYRRHLEDLELKRDEILMDMETALDLSPTDARSLKHASDFDATQFTQNDMKLAVKLRNLDVQISIAKKRFAYLFNGEGDGSVTPEGADIIPEDPGLEVDNDPIEDEEQD